MSAGPRVLLMQLSQRTSAKGNAYLSGWLGRASVVAFLDEQPDKFGNPCWSVFVSTPEPRVEAKSANFAGSDRGRRTVPNLGSSDPGGRQLPKSGSPDPGGTPANPSARPAARGDGYRGPSAYRRLASPRPGAPAGDGVPFFDDDLADIGRGR